MDFNNISKIVVEILNQKLTIQGTLNYLTEKIDNAFWELILDSMIEIDTEQGKVQLTSLVSIYIITPGCLSVLENFYFVGTLINQDVDLVIEANVLSMESTPIP